MTMTSTQRMARILKAMMTITLVCNIIALFIVPSIRYLGLRDFLFLLKNRILELTVSGYPYDSEPIPVLLFGGLFVVWTKPVAAIWTVFLWICGCLTAVILWQARLVVNTVLEGNPFQRANAVALKRVALCCWGVSGVAFIRLVAELIYDWDPAPLLTYNTLFVPGFFAAGLLFMVMSALFRQAAQLQEDQDLTI